MMTIEKLQETLDQCREEAHVAGAAAGFVSGSTISCAYSGFNNLVTKKPIDSNSIFEAASISKLILTYVVLRMVQEKSFGLETAALSLVNEKDLIGSPWYSLLNCEGFHGISIRNILSHSTGLPNWAPTDGIKRLLFPPGRCFQYSGMSHLFLQWVLERHFLTPWQEIANRYVFSPLGMNNSGFVWKDAWEDGLVHGHSAKGIPTDKARFHLGGGVAAGLLTSAADYASFFKELLAKMEDPRSSFSQMYHSQIDRFYGIESSPANHPMAWGLGIGLELTENGPFVWQWGANPFFFNWLVGNPRTQEGLVCFTNSEPGHTMLCTFFERVFGREFGSFKFEQQYLKDHS